MLINWNSTYRFAVGNETSNNRLWNGQVRLVAVYNKVLPESQILTNYAAGATDRFLLRFGLDDWIAAGSYIEFQVSDFDAYSYLFCFPTMVTTTPPGFTVAGLRIAVNGTPPVQSQSFKNVSAMITQGTQQLSQLCSVVPKQLGLNLDQFAIFFDVLEDDDVTVVETPPVIVPDNSVLPARPGIGIRDFDEINNTMAETTGVDPNTPSVRMTFEELRQSLPMDSDIRSFVSSHQVGISKLALEYCNEMVESPALRTAFFGPQFQFDQPVAVALAGQAERDMIINPLIDQMIGTAVATQPTAAETAVVLNALMDDLTAGCTPATCDATRTRTVVKGTCAAVLGSGAVHID